MRTSSPRSPHWRSRLIAGPAVAAILLSACGGESSVEATSPAVPDAEAVAAQAAEDNAALLEGADSVFDVEVLDVADGSVSTLRDTVTGDRPVLVWFYSPH